MRYGADAPQLRDCAKRMAEDLRRFWTTNDSEEKPRFDRLISSPAARCVQTLIRVVQEMVSPSNLVATDQITLEKRASTPTCLAQTRPTSPCPWTPSSTTFTSMSASGWWTWSGLGELKSRGLAEILAVVAENATFRVPGWRGGGVPKGPRVFTRVSSMAGPSSSRTAA